jgi:ketosteroid isomerase-like protein
MVLNRDGGAATAILPPDEPPIIGMGSIRPRYAALFDAYSFDFTGRPEEIAVAGHLAIVRASIEETLAPTGGGPPMEFRGAWLLVLRKQSDGAWKLWRNMWSVYQPPPAPPPN